MTNQLGTRIVLMLAVSAISIPNTPMASSQDSKALPPFPQPVSILESGMTFNAVEFGPGGSFVIHNPPPGMTLESVALSSDGSKAAIGWGSGEIEIRSVVTGKKTVEFKARINDIFFVNSDRWLILSGSGGKVRVSDSETGKTVRDLTAKLGKYKYDVRNVIYSPNEDYWAYVDGEEGRVIRISNGGVMASLGDATDFALSRDGKRLWTVNRKHVALYDTDSWTVMHDWVLRLPISPTSEPELQLGVDESGTEFVAVSSVGGLTLYSLKPEDQLTVTAGRPFIDSSDHLILSSGATETLMDMKGNVICKWQQRPAHRFASSADGKWIALADFDKVSVWNLASLAAECRAR